MANNIFSPTPGYTYGQLPANSNAAYGTWGSQGPINPYIVFGPGYTPGLYNPNTGQALPQQPLQTTVSTSGDDSFSDTTPVGDGYSFGGSGSNSIFGGGVAGASTSPGYSGPYDQGNPLATGNQGFMNELGKSVSDYFNSGGILGMAANAIGGLFGEPAANNDYNAKSYAQEVGVAEGAGPKTFSGISVAQQLADAKIAEQMAADMAAQQANYTNGQLTGGVSYAGTGGSDNFGYGAGSGYDSDGGYSGTDAGDAAAAGAGEEDSCGSGYAGNAGGGFW